MEKDKSQFLPSGKIKELQKNTFNWLNEHLSFIKDDNIFVLIRDIIYAIHCYYNDRNFTSDFMLRVTDNNSPNVKLEHVYEEMKP
jgi:hypothetical protein